MTEEEKRQLCIQRRKYIERELAASRYEIGGIFETIFAVVMKISVLRWLLH